MKTVSLLGILMSLFVMISCDKETFDSMYLIINLKTSEEYQVQSTKMDTLDIEFISSQIPDFERTAKFSVVTSDNDSTDVCKFLNEDLIIPANTKKFNNKLIIDSKKLSEKKNVTLNIGISAKGAYMLNSFNLTLIPYTPKP